MRKAIDLTNGQKKDLLSLSVNDADDNYDTSICIAITYWQIIIYGSIKMPL